MERRPGGHVNRGVRGEAIEPERAEREAARRARTKLRRLCVQNQADKLGTLTFRPEYLPADRAGVAQCWARFRRRMQQRYPDIFMVATIEGDPGVEVGGEDGKRLHIHFAFNRYVPQHVVEQCWALGFVELRKIRTAGEGKRARARRAAHYVGKYCGKEWGGPGGGAGGRSLNGKRYFPPKGFGLRMVQRRLSELGEARDYVGGLCGGPLDGWWNSGLVEGWRGPPCWTWEYGDP